MTVQMPTRCGVVKQTITYSRERRICPIVRYLQTVIIYSVCACQKTDKSWKYT